MKTVFLMALIACVIGAGYIGMLVFVGKVLRSCGKWSGEKKGQ
jgi:hypothetical protein